MNYKKLMQLNSGKYYFKVSSSVDFSINYILNLTFTPSITYNTDNKQNQNIVPEINIPQKYALIVSISDYLYISDLDYCDEDAVSWCDYLKTKSYEIVLLGDKTSSYGTYKITNFATEANIRQYMNTISTKVKSGDQFVFISSGHGSGDGRGNSFLCCLDENGTPQGEYTDKELALDVKKFTDKQVKTICFFDNCFSGGMIPEVVGNNSTLVCATSTCSQNGYGYDVSSYKHGAWTYEFLVKNLSKNPNLSVNDIFTRSAMSYPYKNGDIPQLGGNGSLTF
jgi:hypothetical protein